MLFPVKYGFLILSTLIIGVCSQRRTCSSCLTSVRCSDICSSECPTADDTIVRIACGYWGVLPFCSCTIESSGESTTRPIEETDVMQEGSTVHYDPRPIEETDTSISYTSAVVDDETSTDTSIMQDGSTVHYDQESSSGNIDNSNNTVAHASVGITVSIVVIVFLLVTIWYFKKKSKNRTKSKPVSYSVNNVTYENTDKIHGTDANTKIENMYANNDYTTLQSQPKPEVYADLCKTTDCNDLKNSSFPTDASNLTHVPQNKPNMSLERSENTPEKARIDSTPDYMYINVVEIQSDKTDHVDSSTDLGVKTSGLTTDSKTMTSSVQPNKNNAITNESQYQMLIRTNKVSATHQHPDTNVCDTKKNGNEIELENNGSGIVQNNSEYTSFQFEGKRELSTAYDENDETSRHSDSPRCPEETELTTSAESKSEEDINDYECAYTSVLTKKNTEQVQYEEPVDLSDTFQQKKNEMKDLRLLINDDSYAELILQKRDSEEDTYNTLNRLPRTLPDNIDADYNTLIPKGEFDEESEEYSHLNRSVIADEHSTDSGYGKLELS